MRLRKLFSSLLFFAAFSSTASSPSITPVIARVDHAPQAFFGSDQKFHVTYDIHVANFHADPSIIESVILKNSTTNAVIQTLKAEQIAQNLVIYGAKKSSQQLGAGQSGIIYVHAIFASKEKIPDAMVHDIVVKIKDRVFDQKSIALVNISFAEPIKISPPLKGGNFLAGDSCCDSTLHRRAAIPVNGEIRITQEFAVDYEKLDKKNRIYYGARHNLKNYQIYGEKVYAVADATVVSTRTDMPDIKPGAFPEGTTIDNADGNSVVIELAPHAYALYAHLQPGSVRVCVGQKIKRGDVIGLVGNSGNSLAPHLHFQIMDSPSPLSSKALPYVIDSFNLHGVGISTENFNLAESSGSSLLYIKTKIGAVKNSYPMDLSVISFPTT